MRWPAFALGIAIVAATGLSLVTTFVLPRGGSKWQFISIAVSRAVRVFFRMLSRPAGSFERKDAILAWVGPIALLVQLVCFLGLFIAGYALMDLPWTDSMVTALREAASSLFVVGLITQETSGNNAVLIFAGATGAIAVALQIGYLPSIYQSFNRRESLVTLMESRAGVPAWGPEVLARHQLVGITDALPALYRDWELWAADLAESHISYPVLVWFRSPEPGFSWVLSLLAVLDAAAMHRALCPESSPSEARMCLRMGFTALRRIAQALHWRFDPDPDPAGPLQLTFEDFSYAVDLLTSIGFVVERSAEEAWPHFVGWRVNYEDLAYRLADEVTAPRAPWSGDRLHLPLDLMAPKRPPHRAPERGSLEDGRLRPPPGTGEGAAAHPRPSGRPLPWYRRHGASKADRGAE
jgi:hypothetical protein